MLDLDSSFEEMKFEMAEELSFGTRIKVIGVGGGGSNAVARMMRTGLGGVEFYVINTDQLALKASPVPNKLALGARMTRGLGAGSNPQIGYEAALEDTERIVEILEGADMVFVAAGLGGGTGTGAAPVVASLAKGLNALTVAVVTKPFGFEGPRRMRLAEAGLAQLAQTVDTVISIPNNRLLEILPDGTSILEAFRSADDILLQAVQGISDIITIPGEINRDFADIRAITLNMGHAMMCTASARGEQAILEAARKAINCPLLEGSGIKGAKGVLINITASEKLGLHDVNKACTLISEATGFDDLQVCFGLVVDPRVGEDVKITVIATGFDREAAPDVPPLPRLDGARLGPFAELETTPPVEDAEPVQQIIEAAEPAPPPEEVLVTQPTAEAAPPPALETEPMPANEIDIPPFLRDRQRRMFQ